MRKKQAEKLFCDAMDALAKVGESPLNYCLSYAVVLWLPRTRRSICTNGKTEQCV